MRVRALDSNGDWSFGKGRNSYKRDLEAVTQIVKTRLKSFLGDCFFALDDGIDWFNLNGSKQLLQLRLDISARILNTPNIERVNEINFTLGANRSFLVQYSAESVFGEIRDVLFSEEVSEGDDLKSGSFEILNNSSEIDISEIQLNKEAVFGARIYISLYRLSPTVELAQTSIIDVVRLQDSNSWSLQENARGDDAGVFFDKTITASGNFILNYTSSFINNSNSIAYYSIKELKA